MADGPLFSGFLPLFSLLLSHFMLMSSDEYKRERFGARDGFIKDATFHGRRFVPRFCIFVVSDAARPCIKRSFWAGLFVMMSTKSF